MDTKDMYDLIGILCCILLSAFFSGSETALTSVSTTRINLLIEQSPAKWSIMKAWLASKRRILATLLIGNNIVNIFCSILAYRLATSFLPDFAEAISVFGLTIVILVFAEITPKGIALQHAEKLAVPVMKIIWLLDKLLYPLAQPLSKLPIVFSGGKLDDVGEPRPTAQEIKYHIRRGLDENVFHDKNQAQLLDASIDFSTIQVKEIMVPRTELTALEAHTSIDEAMQLIVESGHSRLPIYENNPDTIVGILYAKDILDQVHKNINTKDILLRKIMRKEVFHVPEVQKISLLLTDMKRRSSHMAIVVDEFGGTAGIITLEDIIEELVGDIHDEHDVDEPEIREVENNRWVVDALISIPDIETETGLEIPDSGDYESIGGFVVASFGRIPKRGKSLKLDGMLITVVESDERHIISLEIKSNN